MKIYKQEIAEMLAPVTGMGVEEIYQALAIPQIPAHGDFSFPCFPLAKRMRKAPAAIAQELSSALAPTASFRKTEAVAGYLNFFVDPGAFARDVLGTVGREDRAFGASDVGGG